MIRLLPIPLLLAAVACTPVPPSPEEVAQACEERARAAQGPTGNVTVGYNSNSGPYSGIEIGVSGDYLAGRDPVAVYTDCVIRRSGQQPYRPPVLR